MRCKSKKKKKSYIYIGIYVKYPLCPTVIKLEFSRQILEKDSVSSFMTVNPVEAELFHADRQTRRS
jgi:hypothetical protein